MDHYVEKEIRDRIERIKALNKAGDTVIIDPEAVQKKINDLLLLSKDVENLGACVAMSSQYFEALTKQYRLNPSDLKRIEAGMHINDIASALKQNEMVLFNHVLLQTGANAVPLHAAQ